MSRLFVIQTLILTTIAIFYMTVVRKSAHKTGTNFHVRCGISVRSLVASLDQMKKVSGFNNAILLLFGYEEKD